MFFERLRIKIKLALIITVLISGLIIYGIVSYIAIEEIRIDGPYYNQIIEGKDLISDILPPPAYIIEPYLMSFQEFIEKDRGQLEKLIERSQALEKEYHQAHSKWSNLLKDGRIKEIIAVQSDDIVESWISIWQSQFLPAILAGDKDKAFEVLSGPLTEKYNQHRKLVDEMVVLANKQNEEVEAHVHEIYKGVRIFGFTTWFLTILLGGIFSWWLIKSLTKQLTEMSDNLESIASQISSSADQQAQSTVQQSSSVNETTTTMDELNASFQHTQAIAQNSSEKSQSSLKVSQDGNNQLALMVKNLQVHKDKVAQIVEHILRLSQLTRQIHNIASVTSNLTNQTNILALNAAVQAAHVKQYGEGFSVIAGEIRKLADESKKFLSHIDVLSENIQEATDSTIKIVDEGNKTILEIISLAENTTGVFQMITSISEGSFEGAQQTSQNIKEQAIAVHQVLQAMENLDESSQQAIQGMQQVRYEVTRLNELSSQLKAIL